MRRLVSLVCVAALSACAGSGLGANSNIPAVPSTAARTTPHHATVQSVASTNWDIVEGSASNFFAVQGLDFYPTGIIIDAGDTITFHIPNGQYSDAHTVSFVPQGQPVPNPGDPNNLNPSGGTTVDGTTFVNSGILVGGQTFALTFTKPGNYRILCLFHEPAMVMSVRVQSAGTPYPHNAAYYANLGAQDQTEDLAKGLQSISTFPFSNGGTTFAAGIDPGLVTLPPPDVTVLRFLNSNQSSQLVSAGRIKIKAGTTLTFVNETSNEPHTVTIALAGQTDLPAEGPDQNVNGVLAPGVNIFDGSQSMNSGSFFGGQSFAVTFTKPGSYLYGCLYHDNSGMVGRIVVTP